LRDAMKMRMAGALALGGADDVRVVIAAGPGDLAADFGNDVGADETCRR